VAFEQRARSPESFNHLFRLQIFIPSLSKFYSQVTMHFVMQLRRNLISDSALLQETVEMLRLCGGCAPVTEVADIVLKLPDLEAEMAALIIADLIKDDHRLRLLDGLTIQLDCEDVEARLLHESEFVVVDVETTGAKTPPCRIAEVGDGESCSRL
jgi:hypothetical protein